MNRGGTFDTFVTDISKAIESYTEQDGAASRQLLNQMAGSDPAGFFAAAIRVVAASKPSEGSRYLVLILAKDKRLSAGLLDAQGCTLQEALAVTRAAEEA